MKENVNLLPQNLRVNTNLTSTLNMLRSIGVISIFAFIIFAVGVGGFFLYSKISLGNIQTNISYLKSQIQAQQASEQKLILLKDRLAKIISVRGNPNADKNIENLESLFSSLSSSSTVDQASVGPAKISLSLVVRNNTDITGFLNNLRASKMFATVALSSFDFSPKSGYSITLDLGNK